MREFRSPDAVERSIGDVLGPSAWRQVEQSDVDAFATVTGDHQWIHVDPVRAAQSRFGGPIAHGYLTLSVIPAFSVDLFQFDFGEARLNYGLDRARFPSPVPVGARIRGSASPQSLERVAAGWRIGMRWVIESDQAERPACVADTVTLVVTT